MASSGTLYFGTQTPNSLLFGRDLLPQSLLFIGTGLVFRVCGVGFGSAFRCSIGEGGPLTLQRSARQERFTAV